jgi:hypothetical protein
LFPAFQPPSTGTSRAALVQLSTDVISSRYLIIMSALSWHFSNLNYSKQLGGFLPFSFSDGIASKKVPFDEIESRVATKECQRDQP